MKPRISLSQLKDWPGASDYDNSYDLAYVQLFGDIEVNSTRSKEASIAFLHIVFIIKMCMDVT